MTIAAVDPGWRSTAVVIAYLTGQRLDLVDATAIEVGRWIDRKGGPKAVKNPDGSPKLRKDGTPVIVTRERECTDADVDSTALIVADLFLTHRVTHARIERVERPYMGDSPAAAASIAKSLLITDRIANRIAQYCEDLRIAYEFVIRRTWAAKLERYARAQGTPLEKVKGSGVQFEPLLDRHLPGIEADPDLRDAAGSLLAGVIPDEAAPLAGAPRKPRAAGPRGPRVRKRKRDPNAPKPPREPPRDWRAEKRAMREAYLATATKDAPLRDVDLPRPTPFTRPR